MEKRFVIMIKAAKDDATWAALDMKQRNEIKRMTAAHCINALLLRKGCRRGQVLQLKIKHARQLIEGAATVQSKFKTARYYQLDTVS